MRARFPSRALDRGLKFGHFAGFANFDEIDASEPPSSALALNSIVAL
jgi:hypothetical protein